MSQWFDPSRPLAEADATPPVSQIYRRIARFMADFRSGLAWGTGLSLLSSVAFALLPWPVRYLIDGVLLDDRLDLGVVGQYGTGTDSEKLWAAATLAVAYLVLQLLAAFLASASFYAFARTALMMIHTLRGRMLAHLRSLSLGYHASRSTGDTIFRAINDARSIQEVMIFGVQAWVMPVFQVVFMVVLMLILDPLLTLAAVIVAPLLVVTIRALTARIQRSSQESRAHLGRLTSLIEQTMASIRAVQVFGSEGDESQRFDGTSRNFMRAQLRFRMAEQALSVATMAITGLATALVLYVAAHRVLDGAVTVGALWIFLTYMQRIYLLLQQNMNLYGTLQDSVVGVGRAFQVLDTEPEIRDRPGAVTAGPLRHGIELRDVRLVYEGAHPVLQGVTLSIQRGEKVALVGPTGAGKTSILNLIPRLYDVSSGAVLLDGVDVRDYTLSSLREQISLVPQEPLLFATTIRENVLYGRRGASDADIEQAARAARAHDFIVGLPQGYDTEVGDRGVRLSIGQQQRVAIARAFLEDAPVLLLDEPTSALDLGTEADLLAGFEQLMVGRTVVIVAHRLSTVRTVDRTYVLDQGRILETGTHHQLLEQGGTYHRLYTSQFPAAPSSAR